ncbi:MAG TPA: hypothetical protein VHE81_01730 [Lacipirellulaceae bacterium]|nr:hypothetical protein [Lacipirellulaceae bacterium]
MRFCLAIILEVVVAVAALGATSNQPTSNGAESLGDQLLNDLAPDAGEPTAPPQPVQRPKSMSEIEASLKASTPFHSFGAGANPTKQTLLQVQHSMQQAGLLLARPSSNEQSNSARLAAPVQQKVLSDLDKLIAELSKQCRCKGGQCQGGQCNKPCDKPGTKPGKSGVAMGSGRTAARDSTDRLDRTSAQPVDKGQIDETVKSLWGNLPARSREQMLQSYSDEFLPKYEIEIEQYYRRLSEEQANSQPR